MVFLFDPYLHGVMKLKDHKVILLLLVGWRCLAISSFVEIRRLEVVAQPKAQRAFSGEHEMMTLVEQAAYQRCSCLLSSQCDEQAGPAWYSSLQWSVATLVSHQPIAFGLLAIFDYRSSLASLVVWTGR